MKISKRQNVYFLQIPVESFQTSLEFSYQWSDFQCLLGENVSFTIAHYGETKHQEFWDSGIHLEQI